MSSMVSASLSSKNRAPTSARTPVGCLAPHAVDRRYSAISG